MAVRADHDTNNRNVKADLFNEPTSNIDGFVSSMTICGQGWNLQACCHTGYIMQFGSSLKKVKQLIGRLFRLGQLIHVHWHIIQLSGSFQNWQEHNIRRKYAHRLMASVPYHEALDKCPKLQLVIACELVRNEYGFPFSNYGWLATRVPDVTSYYDRRRTELGESMSIFAACLIRLYPPHGKMSDFDEDEVDYMLQTAKELELLASQAGEVDNLFGPVTVSDMDDLDKECKRMAKDAIRRAKEVREDLAKAEEEAAAKEAKKELGKRKRLDKERRQAKRQKGSHLTPFTIDSSDDDSDNDQGSDHDEDDGRDSDDENNDGTTSVAKAKRVRIAPVASSEPPLPLSQESELSPGSSQQSEVPVLPSSLPSI